MFYLYNSNRTEILAEQLGVVINGAEDRSLFDTSLFLVQSREMGRMLSQFLADRFGVWGNSSYLLPLQFIEHICETLDLSVEISAFDRSVLVWRIERLLRETGTSELRPLTAYLSGEQRELKRYQLARAIAQLFDQYQIMRPDLIESWQSGRMATDNPSEAWQMYLWTRLCEEHRGCHRGEAIRILVAHLAGAAEGIGGLPRSVYIFGIHTLPPLFVSVLKALSRVVDAHFFLLTPCAHYWADMESQPALIRRMYGAGGENDLEFHRLLAGLGRQGADFQHILLDHIQDEEKIDRPEVFVVNREFGLSTVLHRLQDDMLEGRYESSEDPVSDDSISIVSCHSRTRELAVLRDHIIDWMTADPDLGLHEIVVMAPDIEQYGDLIPALFEDIAHDITDCGTRKSNRYVAIFSEFLELFTGRYSGPDILGLIEHPEVRRAAGMAAGELETLKHWLADAGIRWGLSEAQRREDRLPVFSGGTWQDGLERILLGLASGSTERVGNVLPYADVEGGDAELLGNLCRFVDLIERCRREVGARQTISRWSSLLHRFSLLLFGGDDSPEFLKLQELLTGLGEQFGPYHGEAVAFEVVRQWYEHESGATSASGFLRGRLTFCSMLPMRSIPFNIICLLGINDGEFPNQDRFIPFDLLSREYRRGDRSRRADDRYQFLEAIMAARRRLYISYIGQSVRTNDEIPPSPVITELLETIRHCYGPISARKHPLQPFSEAYFRTGSDLFSYSDYYCRTARAFGSEPLQDGSGWLTGPLDIEPSDQLNISELLSFISNPQRYFVCRVLGLSLDVGEDLPVEQELFSVEGLEKYQLDQYLLQELMNGRERELLLDELQQRQAWPLAYPGHARFAAVVDELEGFIARVREIDPAGIREPFDFSLGFDAITVSGTLSRCSDGGQLFYRHARLKGGDLLKAWLCHLIGRVLFEQPRPTQVIATDFTVVIGEESGSGEDLQMLIDWYQSGCRAPSRRFVEPAFAYCRQVNANKGKGWKKPRSKAVAALKESLEKGYAEEVRILFPDLPEESLIDDAFTQWCDEWLMKLWEGAKFIPFNA